MRQYSTQWEYSVGTRRDQIHKKIAYGMHPRKKQKLRPEQRKCTNGRMEANQKEKGESRKTRGGKSRALSILPGMLVEEETRPKEGPMGKRPVKQSYGDFLLRGRRDKGNGGKGKDGKSRREGMSTIFVCRGRL